MNIEAYAPYLNIFRFFFEKLEEKKNFFRRKGVDAYSIKGATIEI